ncbi:MAG: polysaccharide biosynthesis C-terminal domain-containing protein, partial [Clostridia bacterium]|nr:polysaccharide biosynthesis C-terminal domain-containing protein [Clostridia bacterium]
TANLNAIKAMGRSDLFLTLEIIKKIVGLALLFSTMFISVEAMALSMLASAVLSSIINSFPNKKLLNYSYFEQMKDLLPSLLLSLFMAVAVFFLGFLPLPDIALIAIQVLAGAAIYVIGSILFKFDSFRYLLNTVKSYLKKSPKKTEE